MQMNLRVKKSGEEMTQKRAGNHCIFIIMQMTLNISLLFARGIDSATMWSLEAHLVYSASHQPKKPLTLSQWQKLPGRYKHWENTSMAPDNINRTRTGCKDPFARTSSSTQQWYTRTLRIGKGSHEHMYIHSESWAKYSHLRAYI